MPTFNFKRDCRNIYRHMKAPKQRGGCMPYRTGHLANDSTQGRFFGDDKFTITIITQKNAHGAPYAVYLNEGSRPHNIPNSFGLGPTFGIGGRFNGKFHPGSLKHYGFIDDASNPNSMIGYAIAYFQKHYGASVWNDEEWNTHFPNGKSRGLYWGGKWITE